MISHASKILLRILLKRLEAFLLPELPDEQAGFRRGRGTRDHISNIRGIMELCNEYGQDVYLYFIDYSKAFDCIDQEKLWIALREMGVPDHLILLIRTL